MKALLKASVVVGLMAGLAGCAFVKALTFRSSADSFQNTEERFQIELVDANPGSNIADPSLVCREAARYRNIPPDQVSALIAPAIVIGVAQVLVSTSQSEIQAYLERKQKEFTRSYAGQVSMGYYYPLAGDFESTAVKCLHITRWINASGAGEVVALDFWASLVPNSSKSAMKIRPEMLRFDKAAARTSANPAKIDLAVDIKIDATYTNEKGEVVTTTIGSKILKFPGLALPMPLTFNQDDPTTPPGQCKGKTFLGCSSESSWMPFAPKSRADVERCRALKCPGVTAVTVAVQVTEIGTGAGTYGTLSKQLDDNRKTLDDTIKDLLDTHLKKK